MRKGVATACSPRRFLIDNYLSDDERYPVSELGTNAARARDQCAGWHMWGQMLSSIMSHLGSRLVACDVGL